MKKSLLLLLYLISASISAQIQSENIHLKTYEVKNDSIKIDSVSITPFNFKVFTINSTEIDTTNYSVDFSKALLIFNKKDSYNFSKVIIQYTSYPNYFTKNYFKLNKNLIVPNANNETKLYSLTTNLKKNTFTPFEGLNTEGNITRGLTVGNNQNGVVNATLDLKIEGKISDKVTLKASIIDTNLPIQEDGNTYKLNEFDRVFIELSSKNWNINAGDIYLNNNATSFLKFNKKVSGIAVNAKIDNDNSEINIETSGAIVEGKYKKIEFNGEEGNQGPYQLSDFENTYILILSNTEQIYVNGLLIKRGEENDYVIDYNNSEITFSTTFPITANMRITAEYQYSDNAYTRFVTYNNIGYKSDKLSVSGYFYNENDLKNQSLEQDLSDEQKQLLANAGNDTNLMVSASAYIDTFSDDKILYKKTLVGSTYVFEYSTIETDELYNVSFTYIGDNLGDYNLKDVIAFGKIYEYVGENLGDYNPVTQLTPPNKLQIAVLKTAFTPSNKTTLKAETAFSNNDQNLFSNIDDSNNHGFASKLEWEQIFLQKKWKLKNNFKFDYIHKNFKSIERIQDIEYNRDWNIDEIVGNQKLVSTAIELSKKNTTFKYQFDNLTYGDSYTGNKHLFLGKTSNKNFYVNMNSSLLKNENLEDKGTFFRYIINAQYSFTKKWLGLILNSENNKLTNAITNNNLDTSHKFNEYETFFGVGDSTKVYAQLGVNFRLTDSIQNNKFNQVNNSKTYYLKSTLINSNSANLNTYINYRIVENTNFENEESLNSKITYKQQLFNQFLTFNTNYQTLSGTLPQQDYVYLETDAGQGYYTWIDYNNNNVKELNEFEIAQFNDQASYLRVILSTVNYIATHQNKFSQTITINPQQWNNKTGVKNLLSHFYNQAFVLVDSKQRKTYKKFNLNPFDINNENSLALNFNFNNSFYFNKGKKHYSTTYNFINSNNKSTTTIDDLETKIELHKLQFEHKLTDFWQLNLEATSSKNTVNSVNYISRNYKLQNNSILSKISYYYNNNTYLAAFYQLKNKDNEEGDLESLNLQKLGFEINYANNPRNLLKAEINLFNNSFTGNTNSSVAYQMLEGLQAGKNYTWSLLFYRKLNSFLNLDLNYTGRKSETSKTIHTGTIQLKAFF